MLFVTLCKLILPKYVHASVGFEPTKLLYRVQVNGIGRKALSRYGW